MGKYPSAILVATALAFCTFCPLFVTSKECHVDRKEEFEEPRPIFVTSIKTEEIIIRKGIQSLSNIMVKYQNEFDRKVKFVQLQKAIDEIDTAMVGYQGKAKDKLPLIRSLNDDARLTYGNCVAPVFEWCIAMKRTTNYFIPYIDAKDLSEKEKKEIWIMTTDALDSGINKTRNSLTLLSEVQYKTAALKNLFKAIKHDINDDFVKKKDELVNISLLRFLEYLCEKIWHLITGPIGKALGIMNATSKFETIEDQINMVECFFGNLTLKIENATEIVKDIESALVEDKNNLHELRGLVDGANINKKVLLMEAPFIRASFIPDIQNLQNACTDYVEWHSSNAPLYEKIKSRARRAASSFCEGQRSKAKGMLAESGSSNSTQSQKLGLILDQMDCGGYIPPYSVERFQKWRE
ncbi:uncharacterized protein [Drosophila bipectinata]|uniref:uncharacterized protein n=1 Tax=Drosophila bipectinata TaxID=42026 RepID=UPI0038B29F79